MLSVPYLALYLACGILAIRWLLPRQTPLARLWLGCTAGLLLMMWLPALCAFFLRFTLAAHLAALAPLALLTGLAYRLRDRRECRRWDAEETAFGWRALAVSLPLTVLFAYLQYTHVFRVDGYGAWNVGQSTYGDLPMHTAFIAAMRNAAFPPEYPMFPGHRLTYPFLTDSLSTSFMLLGCPLQAAVILPAVLMFALSCLGVMCLCRTLSAGRKAMVLAALLFFLNGGLGFLYDFDQAGGFRAGSLSESLAQGDLTPQFFDRIQDILTGYYKTPTNQPEPNNLRWSNVIADMFVPQRTFMGGVCMSLPCFYLLICVFDPRRREAFGGTRALALLGIWAGLLPLIHTHSFLALGLCSAGMMGYDLVVEKRKKPCLLRYLAYAGVTLALAAPQLLGFTFYQALGLQPDTLPSGGFLRFQFNWVNNPDGRGMRDFFLWFYLKNIGLPFAVLLLALLERKPGHRRLLCGAGMIWLAAELIRFQPNEYDNNKLFYLAWLLLCPVVADTSAELWRRLKGLRARPVIALAAAVVTFLSAGLTLWREVVSDYQAFDARTVAAAAFVERETAEDAVFLTGTEHLNPVVSIAGRRIVCGPDLWLYYHGFNTRERQAELRRFYADPGSHLDILEKYGVDYIFVSDYERSDYTVDEDALEDLFELVYREGDIRIYRRQEG